MENENATAHGLDGSLVQPDWPPLTLAEVRRVLLQYPTAGEPIAVLSTSPRPFSAGSVIETSSGKIFVKRHSHSVRDIEGLAEEHSFMLHLRAHGIGVPAVLATVSGATGVESGSWTYEVHELPEGIDLYQDAISWTPFRSVEHAHSAGEKLARMHKAAESFSAPARKTQPLVASFSIFASLDAGFELEQYLEMRPALAQDSETRRNCEEGLQLLAPFYSELKPLLPSLRPLWTHNDMHASNLFWSDATDNAHATSVIDFGLSDRTNCVHDLAHAIERNVVEWLVLMNEPAAGNCIPVHLDQLWAMLDGYEQVRPLSPTESAALVPMVALCHVEFALSEAEYFLSVLRSTEKARVATLDYLVGHALWFCGPGRSRLLDPLRVWAETRNKLAADR